MYRHSLKALFILAFVIVVALRIWFRATDHSEHLAEVTRLQTELQEALSRNWERAPSRELVSLVDPETAREILKGFSLDERNRLGAPECEWVSRDDLAQARQVYTCSSYLVGTAASDIFCRTTFRADKDGWLAKPSEFAPSLTGEGCLLTLWSRDNGVWIVKAGGNGLVVDEERTRYEYLMRQTRRELKEMGMALEEKPASQPAGD